MYRKYAMDPRWMIARFGKCLQCGTSIKDKRAFYYPRSKDIYCEKCGEAASRDFESCAMDEAIYNNQF